MMYATFDIETRDWIEFEVMGLYTGDYYKKFLSIEGFLSHIGRKVFDGWRFYAHNGGRFDFLFLLQPMIDKGWKLRILPRGSTLLLIDAEPAPGVHIQFADSYALLPLSLRELGESFNVKVQKGSIDYKKISATDSKTLRYLEDDCVSLYQCLQVFFDSPYVVQPQLTIASQALDTFKRKFFKGKLSKFPVEAERDFRKNYYAGGRVEVFKGYGTNLTEYDVNSLFPFAMLGDMPSGVPHSVTAYDRGRIGFYNVQVLSAPEFWIPPFLVKVRTSQESKNYYVTGPGIYFMSSDWVEHLRSVHGVKMKILSGWVFPERKPLFNSYVETFFSMKQRAARSPEYQLAKLMLNALYGKLGARRERETIVTYNDALGEDFVPFNDDMGLVLVETMSSSIWILPYLAAYITDRARLHHWRLMMEHENQVFYCDTDSIITSASHVVGSGIGELSEKGTYTEGVFVNSKCYALKGSKGEKVKFKGFDTSQFSFADMLDRLRTRKPLVEERTRLLSFREAVSTRNGKPVRRKKGVIATHGPFLTNVKTRKEALPNYDKRLTIPSRKHIFTTKPFTYSDIQERSTVQLSKKAVPQNQLNIFFTNTEENL